ncbi:methylmalonyl Co-A mutase-associated GTPase MeaB [Desulfatibacillum aliphaticivorans]|uniref:methylmalonyl Co-A mutase-associated GTPase MeaB n=1 Tax=Desulfatibacillum aliphaticivorans TaxID=218208 RepID=UPI0003FCF505|nr:methylmalonyl Co-A mutase-associated GTPase MeaB [Desulfatibacillum aliphaticivorans]
MQASWETLLDGVKKGNERSLARIITLVENRENGWKDAMKRLYPLGGKAKIIGVTGSPGAGKSTLTNSIARELVSRGRTVGIIAVDPSSPFSGGALLGDRLRMRDAVNLPEIFIRSMATRGALGGLCQGARDVSRILDAFGKDVILIETVGVGQDEVEVVKTADIVMVVCVPGQGDGIQALKAGIMEIADLYVVNKADKEGADEVAADIGGMLDIASEGREPRPPILKTSAIHNLGVTELVDALVHGLDAGKNRAAWQAQRIKEEILSLLESEILNCLQDKWDRTGDLDKAIHRILKQQTDPYSAADSLLPLMREAFGIKETT